MKLEELAPPVELCREIPEGEFSDTALVWHLVEVVGFVCRTSGCDQVSGQEWRLTRSNAGWLARAKKRGEKVYPAPLLEEILPDLKDFSFSCDGNMATAALKLWLITKKGQSK